MKQASIRTVALAVLAGASALHCLPAQDEKPQQPNQTQDEVHPVTGDTCYGHALCQDIAQNHVAIAINNADNYEFFCEEYWEGVFQQKPQSATNAIPDGLKRKIQDVL